MKGTIHYFPARNCWYVQWYYVPHQKAYKIYNYRGMKMHDKATAERLRTQMQGDFENGTFRIEKYTKITWAEPCDYLDRWLVAVKGNLAPSTFKDYSNSTKNHLKPYFKAHRYLLNEIQYDTLVELLNSIKRAPKGKYNVMNCLHACLTYAWRSGRIPAMPAFPEKRLYGMIEKKIEWLTEDVQVRLLDAIPEDDQPIFWWLKYHLRRPGEAMALYKTDYDQINDVFTVRRGISDRQVVEHTKTRKEHVIPTNPDFHSVLIRMKVDPDSPYFFTCPSSRMPGKRYTDRILQKIWHEACASSGIFIRMYAGLKHSSCSQYINEKGLSLTELQDLTDHARLESVKRYARTETTRKRELWAGKKDGKILPFKKEKKVR